MKIFPHLSFCFLYITVVYGKPIKGRRGFCQLYENIKETIATNHTVNDAVEDIKHAMIEGFASDIHCYDIKVHLPDLQVCHQRVPGLRYNFKWTYLRIENNCENENAARVITNITCRAAWLFNHNNSDYHPHFGSFVCYNNTATRQEIPLSPSLLTESDLEESVIKVIPIDEIKNKKDELSPKEDKLTDIRGQNDEDVTLNDNTELSEQIVQQLEDKSGNTTSLNNNGPLLSAETQDSKENVKESTSTVDSSGENGFTGDKKIPSQNKQEIAEQVSRRKQPSFITNAV